MASSTKVINFFGAPGAGKSTTAMDLASKLKRMGYKSEYVSEFAKDYVWSDSSHLLVKQNWILGNQEFRLSMLDGKVDFIVTDSPLLMSNFYCPPEYPTSFNEMVWFFHSQYNNVNFLIAREHKYEEAGRIQSEQEASDMEATLEALLIKLNVDFEKVGSTSVNMDAIITKILTP